MIQKLICIFLTFLSFGCSGEKSVRTDRKDEGATVWRASRANGDKPGVGYELIRTPKGDESHFKGTFYMLDPNKPHDFISGQSVELNIFQANDYEVHFQIPIPALQNEKYVFYLEGDWNSDEVYAIEQTSNTNARPLLFKFKRMK